MKSLFKTAFVACIGFLVACAEGPQNELPQDQEGIVGGTFVIRNDIESKKVVLIYSSKMVGRDRYMGFCTGVLVAPNIVLTAAHCIDKESEQSLVFDVSYKKMNTYNTRSFESWIVPRAYLEKEKNETKSILVEQDLALVKFRGFAPQGYEVQELASYSDISHLAESGFKASSIGYGKTSGQANIADTGFLRRTSTQIVGFNKKYNYFVVDQTSGQGICQGDSGGPGFVSLSNGQQKVFGIAHAIFVRGKNINELSNQKDFDKCKHQAYYISVPFYKEWIESNIKILNGDN